MKKIICLALALITCLSAFSFLSFAAEEDYELLGGALGAPLQVVTLDRITATATSDYPTNSIPLVDADVDVKISVFKPTTVDSETPIAFYVMNFVGADDCTDAQNIDCINDLLDQGCVVAAVDFMEDPRACLPNLDWFVQYIRCNRGSLITAVKGYSSTDAYVVPEGYGLTRKIVYFDYEHNAPEGTLENIVKVYNDPESNFNLKKGNANKPDGYETAEDVFHCVRPNTSPIILELMLDMVYPRFREDSNVVMVASSSEQNMSVVRKLQRPLDTSALVRGYTAVVYEHPYVPMSRADSYGYFDAYSYMHNLGHKSHAAAARCVRYYADTYGYSKEGYASMGISKMAMAGVLTNPNIDDAPDRSYFSGYNRKDAYGEQPYLAYEDGTPIDSSVDIAYAAMGDGVKFTDAWLTEGCAPIILACGLYDEYDAWGYWEKLQGLFDDRNLVYYPYSAYNLGHDYPYGECDYYHYDRWAVFYDIISYYLEGDREARVAFASIYNGKVVGDVVVSDRVITEKNKYVSSTQTPGDELFVQFIAPITEESAKAAISLVDANGNKVEGSLRSMCGGLKWYFEPSQKLPAGSYTLVVADNTAKSILNGSLTTQGGEWQFVID
jgi:hypothetical protein